ELILARLALAVDLADQAAEGGVQPVLAEGEVQGFGHLGGSVAAGAGVGHGQGGREAVGREEQVAVLLRQLAVQFQGEGVVAAATSGFTWAGGWATARPAAAAGSAQVSKE